MIKINFEEFGGEELSSTKAIPSTLILSYTFHFVILGT